MRGGVQQAVVAQVHARHILLRTNELEDDQTVEQKLGEHPRRACSNGGEDFAAIAAVTSQDPGSAADGGDLGWAGPGTFVPEFEKQLAGAAARTRSAKPFKSSTAGTSCQLLGRRAARRDRGRAPSARVRRIARSQGRRRNRAVAAPPARRGVRGIQDVNAAASRGSSSDLAASRQASGRTSVSTIAGRDWPCELVVAADMRAAAGSARSSCGTASQLSAVRTQRQRAAASSRGTLRVLHVPVAVPVQPGAARSRQRALRPAACSIAAVDGCMSGEFAAMVTAPVQKSVINDAGMPFSGHTEYLAERTGGALSGDDAGERTRCASRLRRRICRCNEVSAAITDELLQQRHAHRRSRSAHALRNSRAAHPRLRT